MHAVLAFAAILFAIATIFVSVLMMSGSRLWLGP
jgi:hypothetical protein